MSKNLHLKVQILQNGVPQSESVFPLHSLMRRKCVLGGGGTYGLNVPFSSFPEKTPIFVVGRSKAYVLLQPRVKGFLNTGKKAASVAEFISPPGSLTEIASADEPLAVELSSGAWGSLSIYGYEIIFKTVRLTKSPATKQLKVQGAGIAPFSLPTVQTSSERIAVPIALLMSAAIFIPLIYWVLTTQKEVFPGIGSLPPTYLVGIVHPDHLRVLPYVYDDKFNANNPYPQAIEFVSELRKRWSAAEVGKEHQSHLDFLKAFPHSNVEKYDVSVEQFGNFQRTWNKTLGASRGGFYKAVNKIPQFVVHTAGGLEGSIESLSEHRVGQLATVHQSLISMLRTEFRFLKRYYSERRIILDKIFAPPKFDVTSLILAAPLYKEEKKRYLDAEKVARLSEEKQNLVPLREKKDTISHRYEGVTPAALVNESLSDSRSEETAFLENARLSASLTKAPPEPKKVITGVVDREEVNFIIKARNEEIKYCYDNALRKGKKLQGTMVLSWIIDLDGKAKELSVKESDMGNPMLAACLKTRLSQWKFPPAKKAPVAITYPFKFVLNQ